MKRPILLVALIFFSLFLNARKVIQMTKEGGVFKISCTVNGAKMKMIFDTGASSVSISRAMANYLLDNNYITTDDFVGRGRSQTADGSFINHVVINLKDIEISGLHLRNIKAVVIDKQNAPLLLGQTAIQQLGSITLEGNNLIINDAAGNLSAAEIAKLEKELELYLDNGSFRAALDVINKIESSVKPSPDLLSKKAQCLFMLNEYTECIETCLRWEKFSGNEISGEDIGLSYRYLCRCYMYGPKNYEEAIKWGEKAVQSDIEGDFDDLQFYFDYLDLSVAYSELKNYSNAIRYAELAISHKHKDLNTTPRDVIKGKVDDKYHLGLAYYLLAGYYFSSNDNFSGAENMIYSAMCGYDHAIRYCFEHNIKYKEKAQSMLNR